MKSVFNFFVAIMMIIFLLFRIYVAATFQKGQAFSAVPMDLYVEITILFISVICIPLVVKRIKVGGFIYAFTNLIYYGTDVVTKITRGTLSVNANFISSIAGIIIAILVLMDIASYNIKPKDGVKTEWFFDSEIERTKDSREDKNNYRIY